MLQAMKNSPGLSTEQHHAALSSRPGFMTKQPTNKLLRCFEAIRTAGYAELRDGGWHITNAGTLALNLLAGTHEEWGVIRRGNDSRNQAGTIRSICHEGGLIVAVVTWVSRDNARCQPEVETIRLDVTGYLIVQNVDGSMSLVAGSGEPSIRFARFGSPEGNALLGPAAGTPLPAYA